MFFNLCLKIVTLDMLSLDLSLDMLDLIFSVLSFTSCEWSVFNWFIARTLCKKPSFITLVHGELGRFLRLLCIQYISRIICNQCLLLNLAISPLPAAVWPILLFLLFLPIISSTFPPHSIVLSPVHLKSWIWSTSTPPRPLVHQHTLGTIVKRIPLQYLPSFTWYKETVANFFSVNSSRNSNRTSNTKNINKSMMFPYKFSFRKL